MRIFYQIWVKGMQHRLFSSRKIYLYASMLCAIFLGMGFYAEYAQHLHPCALCIAQRGVWFILCLLLAAASLHNSIQRGLQIYGCATLLSAGVGAFLAGRQIWLEWIPHPSADLCLPGFSTLITYLPLKQVISMLFMGSAQCGEVVWTIWGWSIARWSFVWFLLFGVLGGWQVIKGRRKSR